MLITCLRGLRVQWNSKLDFEFNVYKFLYSVEQLDQSEVFVSRVQTEQNNSVSRQEIFRFLLKQVAIFEMSYLLDYWDLECACHPDCSARSVENLGALLVQV
jgi:hypothetical protein